MGCCGGTPAGAQELASSGPEKRTLSPPSPDKRSEAIKARAAAFEPKKEAAPAAERPILQPKSPSNRIVELGTVVAEAFERVAAMKMDVDVECKRITTNQVGPSYIANSNTEIIKMSAEDRSRYLSAFAVNTSITTLELSNTNLDNAAALIFAQMLTPGARCNTTLTSLNIESNHIGTVGIVAIANMLPVNTTLRELKLTNQQATISSEAELLLAEQLEHNTTLLKLAFDARVAHPRLLIDRWLMRNTELRRQRSQNRVLAPTEC